MADQILTSPSDAAAWTRGAELAFSMLSDIENADFDETGYEPDCRDDRPQKNIVAAYLAKVRDTGDSRCELAFAAILTDYIGTWMHAGEPCLEACREHYARRPIATVPRTGTEGLS